MSNFLHCWPTNTHAFLASFTSSMPQPVMARYSDASATLKLAISHDRRGRGGDWIDLLETRHELLLHDWNRRRGFVWVDLTAIGEAQQIYRLGREVEIWEGGRRSNWGFSRLGGGGGGPRIWAGSV
jgi:hypothetical protein